jgi:hypothetical protein
MARDLNVQSKIVDSDQYVYRQERDILKTDVDWNTVTKELTDTIEKVRDDRQAQKAEIETSTIESMGQLAEIEKYDSQSLNVKILEGSEWGSNFLASQNDLMKRGLIKPASYMQSKQKVSDSFTQLKKALGTFDADYKEAQKRMNSEIPGEQSNAMEQWQMGEVSGFANLGEYDFAGNPATGNMNFVKKGKDASNPQNLLSLNSINGRLTQRSNYVSLTKSTEAEIGSAGAQIQEVFDTEGGMGSVIGVEDFLEKEGAEGMLERMVGVVTANAHDKISIMQDLGVNSDMYSSDPEEVAANPGDGTKQNPGMVLMVPSGDGQGTMKPEFSPEQVKLIDETAEIALKTQLDKKITALKGHQKWAPPQPSPANINANRERMDRFGYIDQTMGVITGNNAEFNSSVSSLKTAWDKDNPDNPMAEDNPIDRSSDPNYIFVNYANGPPERIAKFKLDANGDQILDNDGNPVAVADELLVQNLLTKVAPVTGSTEALMDEYIKENPDGLVDRGKRGEKTSYQGTGEETFKPVNLASVYVDDEGGTLGDSFVEASKLDSGERGTAISAAVTETLAKTLKGITSNYEVQFDGNWFSNPTVTVTIDGEVEEITFDGRDPSDLQLKLQRVINERRAKGKGSKSSTSNNSGGKVR